jgi:5'-3' exonuclease
MNYILIDTSYMVFYRYHALIRWWKHSHETELPANLLDCEEFVTKFIKLFSESILKIKKQLKLHKKECTVIAGVDCSRKDIWRNSIYPRYKENRYVDDGSAKEEDATTVADFFKLVYANDNELLKKAGTDHIFRCDKLEGDDVLAITKNHIRAKYPDANIYIITNDHDYLQLHDENTHIINLQFKNLMENKKVFAEADKNLFYKIVLGDKSDCIPPVFSKCGPKTAEKYYLDQTLFDKAIIKENAEENFLRNKTLVCFTHLPTELVECFMERYKDELAEL